jgi:hypothetical protein
MPRTIFDGFKCEHCISAITAIADAGLLAVMRPAAKRLMEALAAKELCSAITRISTNPELSNASMPPQQITTVLIEIKATCTIIGFIRLIKSGKKISAPAAPAMKDSESLLTSVPINQM